MTNLSVVDRSVCFVIANPDDTASRRLHGITPSLERLYRLHATSLLLSASQLLKLKASTYATSCTIFHRYCHQVSLQDSNVWSIAMACTLLACKLEEDTRAIRHIILVYARLYRRRRLLLIPDDTTTTTDNQDILTKILQHPQVVASSLAKELSFQEKEARLRQIIPMSPLGPVYDLWYQQIVDTEQHVLRQLGFTLYWIPDAHAHKFLLYFCRILECRHAARAWDYCHQACRLDFCLRFAPELMACAAIILAEQDDNNQCDHTDELPYQWWHSLIGNDKDLDLATIANAILSLADHSDEENVIATKAFLKSIHGDAFNDPDSYLWSIAD